MMSMLVLACDSCGLPIELQMGEDCPRCGYPINVLKEEQFLETSLRDLQRVATYEGANITVAGLIKRYQERLNYLRQRKTIATSAQAGERRVPEGRFKATVQPIVSGNDTAQGPVPRQPVGVEIQPSEIILPVELSTPLAPAPQPEHISVASSIQSVQAAPKHTFSWKAFFEDQTINIIASLGAFLILVGSLSFVATTADLLLSFLVVLIVHAVFGAAGAVFYRFRSFRTVAIIYSTIFALLVPLVGFSGYRLALGHIVQFSTPTLVAIAAGYAAIIYSGLAIYQRFRPFGYLAVVALTVADLALALAFQLGLWWWPSILMLLALPALLVVPRRTGSVWPFTGDVEILRAPVRVLMVACVAVCGLGVISMSLWSFSIDRFGHSPSQVRFSILSMMLFLLCWICLYMWRTMQTKYGHAVPYLFLSCVLAFSHALDFRQSDYALALTAVAFLYYGLYRFVPQLLQPFDRLGKHIEVLALVLVGLVPFIAFPLLPLELFARAYTPTLGELRATGEIVSGLIALMAGLVLTLSVIFSHTGLRKTPDTLQARWCWLLLLSGFLLNWAYSVVVLMLEPVWCFLGLTLIVVAAAVVVRRFVGALWANPLDVLVLAGTVQTLALSLAQRQDIISTLLLFFAVLSYSVLFYQRRQRWLFLPFAFSILACPFLLLQRTSVMLLIGLLFPLACGIGRHLITNRGNVADDSAQSKRAIIWEWPLLVVGLFYGGIVSLNDLFVPTSTLQSWLHLPFPVALEMAVLSLVWYASAVLARVKWWLFAAIGFAVVAVLIPTNPFWVLVELAPILALVAFGVSGLAGRTWALPLFITSVLAAVMMGITAYYQDQLATATWVLLGFALLIYLIGLAESQPLQTLFLWIAPFFAVWSVYDAALLGDLYRPPVIALLCAGMGIGISSLRFNTLAFFSRQGNKFLHFALPFYATALAAAVLTGVYGTLAGVNHPFYAAVPVALLIYALVAYGVLLFEQRSKWLWMVAAFGLWGTLLALQTTSCLALSAFSTAVCSMQVQITTNGLTTIALVTGFFGLLAGRLVKQAFPGASTFKRIQENFAWSWAWYLISLTAILVTVGWNHSVGTRLLPETIEYGCLFAFIALTTLVMLVERAPELLVLPATLAAWALSLAHWQLWQLMVAYSLLCVLIFAARFIWNLVPAATGLLSPTRLHDILSLGGQIIIVLAIIVQGGLFETGLLAHVGAGSLFVLAALVCWYGHLQPKKDVERWCDYCAGFLLSLVVLWELLAFRQTGMDLLSLGPASYLIVAASFLSRDEALPRHQRIGQICSILGAVLLLFPTLWLSFSQDNLQPTLILAGESLALLLLGLGVRMRIFILSGAGLLVVGAMHALFLPSLGIPSSLALTILGGTLLAVATTLSLTRRRLQRVWTQWE